MVIEPSALEKNMLWAASDDGRVHITKDGGGSWKKTLYVNDITGIIDMASNKNKGEALLIANDYRRFNYEAYAYRTKNYGKTWERIYSGHGDYHDLWIIN